MAESSENSALRAARIQWRDGETPEAEAFGDVYFSRHGGLAESEHVFLQHNGLPARFAQVQDAFFIAETGFGTGLNALLTFERWRQHAPAQATLHFISFEKFPLRRSDLVRAHAAWPELREMARRLKTGYPPLTPGWHYVSMGSNMALWLWFGDVHDGLADLEVPGGVDAWYLDGFAPSRNPQMWTPPLYAQMARLSHADTTAATFTAAGVVRRGLQAAGFCVEKVPGFGRKREMVRARFAAGARRAAEVCPEQVNVVGAGLAGAAVARVLADAGVQVTVYEAQAPASGASGNWAGVLHPLLTADWSLRSQWYQLALEQALPRWQALLDAGASGALQGLRQVLVRDAWQERVRKFMDRFPDQDLIQPVDVECVSGYPAIEYRQGGWLSPPELVHRLLDHARIETKCQAFDTTGGLASRGDCGAPVVWATGCGRAPGLRLDAIRPVKGQVTRLHGVHSVTLSGPLVHEGYSVVIDGDVITGATFEKTALDRLVPTPAGRRHNVMLLQRACGEDFGWGLAEDRVSLRPTTFDHMPLSGLVEGVGFSLGHGARGLTSVWQAAVDVAVDLKALRQPVFRRHRHMTRVERLHSRADKC